MRIFIVCPRLCHGGAERVAVSLANGFTSKGHSVSFYSDLFEEQSYYLDDSIKLFNLVSTPFPKIRKWGSAILNLRKAIKKENPDVIIGIMSLCSLVAWIAAIGLNTTVIATEHNAFERPESSPMSLWDRIYKFHISKIFKCLTVLTDVDKKVLGDKNKKVVVMPNPLAIVPVESVPEKKKVVLAAGRVDIWNTKGFDVLLKAWGSLNSQNTVDTGDLEFKNGQSPTLLDEWQLRIAGVWRNDETIRYLTGLLPDADWVEHNGRWKSDHYHIEFLGFVDDMKSLYQDASVFVLSSRYEGFGLVLIEAMSQGCACVACDYKGRQREIFEELIDVRNDELKRTSVEVCENGILCEVNNVEALAIGMKKMMEDEKYRRKVQMNSVERSKAYGIERTIHRWENLMNQIIH